MISFLLLFLRIKERLFNHELEFTTYEYYLLHYICLYYWFSDLFLWWILSATNVEKAKALYLKGHNTQHSGNMDPNFQS